LAEGVSGELTDDAAVLVDNTADTQADAGEDDAEPPEQLDTIVEANEEAVEEQVSAFYHSYFLQENIVRWTKYLRFFQIARRIYFDMLKFDLF